uniref:GED domain-containing protein n=1 Tax=Mycena chlorophos TaxID=658473 RepID=A0ABQ0LHZ8_MYCCL|nr:predicted protein [Mycena chlorophos]
MWRFEQNLFGTSNEFLAQQPGSLDFADIFESETETGIPAISSYLADDQDAQHLKICENIMQKLGSLFEDIESQVSGKIKFGMLDPQVKRVAAEYVEELESKLQVIVAGSFDQIESDVAEFKTIINEAIDEILTESITESNAFVATTNPSVLPHTWCTLFNELIPSTLKKLKERIQKVTAGTENQVVTCLRGGRADAYKELTAARISLNLNAYAKELLATATEIKTRTQRAGMRSFEKIARLQLQDCYRRAHDQSGSGALERMKVCRRRPIRARNNVILEQKIILQFVEDRGDVIFGAIKDHISKELDRCCTQMQKEFDDAALEIPMRLRLMLIDRLDLTEEHREMRDAVLKVTQELRPKLEMMAEELEHQSESIKREQM